MRFIIWLLTWLSTEPSAVEAAQPRAAAAVQVAYATVAREPRTPGKQEGEKSKVPPCESGTCPPRAR